MTKHPGSGASTMYIQSKTELSRKERTKTTLGCLGVVVLCISLVTVLFWAVRFSIDYALNVNIEPIYSSRTLPLPGPVPTKTPLQVSMNADEGGGDIRASGQVRAGSMSRAGSTIEGLSESYKILDQSEVPDRIVAGRMESVTYTVVVQPKSVFLPESSQLEKISQKLHSDLHNNTYVYFYLPGMNRNGMPWGTAHFVDSAPYEVRINNSALPARYKHLGDPSKREWEL